MNDHVHLPTAAMTTAAGAPPPAAWMPRRVLGIGVTGHRLERLGSENVDAVAAASHEVLAMLTAACASCGNSFRIVSSLADGADSIVAEAGLARGWALDVVLPFDRAGNAADFPEGGARDDHDGLIARARSVFELPGDRAAPGGSGVAYERASRVVLAQSDILLAVWDGGALGTRGGAAQMVAEAVLQGIPVIHVDSGGGLPAILLWDGLEAHDLGQHTVETVPRAPLDALPAVVAALLDPPAAPGEIAMLNRFETGKPARASFALAYPLLLAITGVRSLRRTDMVRDTVAAPLPELPGGESGPPTGFDIRRRTLLAPRFARANATATDVAQLFRSSYVINFSFAALAVVVSLLGLALPGSLKPLLIVTEFGLIATILILTRVGNRANWHRRWLDNRLLAERLRCVAISAQLGDLDLRAETGDGKGWVNWYARATARELGLPPERVDLAYLARVREGLTALIDDQIAYLAGDATRMHQLEHRLHALGTILFGLTALVCVAFLAFKAMFEFAAPGTLETMAHPVATAVTIAGAALPAIGAAIYGIRMQGDFAGNAERSHALADHLAALRQVIDEDELGFDTLNRRVRHTADLLTEDIGIWLRTYRARPLALPG